MSSVNSNQQAFDIVIVGGGIGAGYACHEIARTQVGALKKPTVLLLSAESELPYERSNLIQSFLYGHERQDRAPHVSDVYTCRGSGWEAQDQAWYDANEIVVQLDSRVVDVDPTARSIRTAAGDVYVYKRALILATGSSPVQLPGLHNEPVSGDSSAHGKRIHYLGSSDDVQEMANSIPRLEDEISPADQPSPHRVVVVGGGLLGVEAAAALSSRARVTLVHNQLYLMDTVLTPEISDWYRNLLEAKGIQVVTGDCATSVIEQGDCLRVGLLSGLEVEADAVVAAVGVDPNTSFLQGVIELDAERGFVVVDGQMQTSQPGIYAIGDIASFPFSYGHDTLHIHVAHSDHARKSASHAVKAVLLHSHEDYLYTPYVYCRLFEDTEHYTLFEHYGIKQQDSLAVHFGTRGSEAFGVFWLNPIVVGQADQRGEGTEEDFQLIAGMLVGGVPSEFEAVGAAVYLKPLLNLEEVNKIGLEYAFSCLDKMRSEALKEEDHHPQPEAPRDISSAHSGDLYVTINGRSVDVVASLKHAFRKFAKRRVPLDDGLLPGTPAAPIHMIDRAGTTLLDVEGKECNIAEREEDIATLFVPKPSLWDLCSTLDLDLSAEELREAQLAFKGKEILYDDFQRWWLC